MKPVSSADLLLIANCLKQKAAGKDMEAYLRSEGIDEQKIPEIIASALKIDQCRRAARNRMQEGGVITAIGLSGIAYSTAAEKDGTAWVLWSVVGLGILANGWWKKKKVKAYY